jgi:hypothetical protein
MCKALCGPRPPQPTPAERFTRIYVDRSPRSFLEENLLAIWDTRLTAQERLDLAAWAGVNVPKTGPLSDIE